MASTPLLPDPSAFTGAWTIRKAGAGATSCRVVLGAAPATQGARMGHRLQAPATCLRKLGAPVLTIWRPETDGIVIEGVEPQEVLLFTRKADGRYRAHDRRGRSAFFLDRR